MSTEDQNVTGSSNADNTTESAETVSFGDQPTERLDTEPAPQAATGEPSAAPSAPEATPHAAPSSNTAPAPDTAPAVKIPPTKSGPITGSIVWGALVLVFCAYVASREMGGVIDPITWIIATFIGLGALLLVVGMIIVLRGSRDRR